MVKLEVGCVCWMLAAISFGAESERPYVRSVGMVSPNIVLLNVRAQRVEFGRQIPYESQPGDAVSKGLYRFVKRNGKTIGTLVANGSLLRTADELCGEPLNVQWAVKPESYRVVSSDDARFAKGITPQAIHRKSRPFAFCRTSDLHGASQDHFLFLILPAALETGKHYTVELRDGNLRSPSVDFVYDASHSFSEAVHVSQIGFRPDDPAKVAFLSCWMGDGGGLSYPEGLAFSLIDQKNGEVVFAGKTRLSKRATDGESNGPRNYEMADVYAMDFSSFATPGMYRISVAGIGCSFPFPIAQDAWTKAFQVSIRGLFHQRSGIALGPPFTTYIRPRCFHPDDGVKIYHTNVPTEASFAAIVAGKTDEIVPNAWGGYMDAGDWDRRPGHIYIPLLLLDLCEMTPASFDTLNLNLPESDDNLPDLLNEALWEIDFCKRLQTPAGGIRPGINSAEHPRRGEASWQESLTVMAYAPNAAMSYNYASVAAHAASLVETRDPEKAKGYRESALKAFQWAEQHSQNGNGMTSGRLRARVARGSVRRTAGPDVSRILAAVEFFRLTGESKWQDIFLAATRYQDANAAYRGPSQAGSRFDPQDEAAWIYYQTDRPGMDASVKANFKRALLADADAKIACIESTAFRWVAMKNKSIGYSTSVIPDAISLVRAHYATKDAKYLRAAVLACQQGAGANPLNLCYTTGVGTRNQQRMVHEDSYASHQPLPPGLTVNGPYDPLNVLPRQHVRTVTSFRRFVYPEATTWPALESYFDVGAFPPMNEFTVHRNIAPNAYVWGYLAARP